MNYYIEPTPVISDEPAQEAEPDHCAEAVVDASKIIHIDGRNLAKQRAKKAAGASSKLPGNSKNSQPQSDKDILPGNLFRLFVKNGEYVYARPEDILVMESCDHLVKVHLGTAGKVKLTIRHSTLKDFLSLLPEQQFLRIGRFCAINIERLSGGNCNRQTFEFDYNVSIKLKHAVSNAVFTCIGI